MQKMLERLQQVAEEAKTILCFGIDPQIEKIISPFGTDIVARPIDIADVISNYFIDIADKLIKEHQISAIKPNYAYFAQYGIGGVNALQTIVTKYKNKIPVILDGKRGDIGKSSEAYAKEIYDYWQADATTVSPYMGNDSVKPFLRDDKIVYMLCRTSNIGANDFQELKVGKRFLYEIVAEKAVEWNCGLVVGATSDSIKRIIKITKNKLPFLIPGIGNQGGDLEMVLKEIKSKISMHRINASSSIAYAYEKHGSKPAEAALWEAKKLNETIRKYFL